MWFPLSYLFLLSVSVFWITEKNGKIVNCDIIYTVHGCFFLYIYCISNGTSLDKGLQGILKM